MNDFQLNWWEAIPIYGLDNIEFEWQNQCMHSLGIPTERFEMAEKRYVTIIIM